LLRVQAETELLEAGQHLPTSLVLLVATSLGLLWLMNIDPRIAFIPFIAAGDPDLETTEAAVRSLDAIGADIIELGVPYSVRKRGNAILHACIGWLAGKLIILC